MIRDSIKPDVTMFVGYETLSINEKKIIAINIQNGTSRPYYLSSKGLKPSGVYVRNKTSTDPASEISIRKMIKETDGDSFEKMRSLEQDLTFNSMKEQFNKRNVEFNNKKMQMLGMIPQDGIYSNVSFLLSDQCFPTIKAATFNGIDKTNFKDRKEFSGSLFQQMEDVYAYLDIRNNKKSTFDGLYRSDQFDYPKQAIREALLNSIIHRLSECSHNIKDNGFVTRKDVEYALGVSQATANRILKEMMNNSILYQVGNGKNTKYKRK